MTQGELETDIKTAAQNDGPDNPHGHRKPNQLVQLLTILGEQGYRFTTVTPLSHHRFLTKNCAHAKNLQDIFGWSMPFEMSILSPSLQRIIIEAELAQPINGERDAHDLQHSHWKSAARVSSLGNDLLLHSAFPTSSADAVFFGPDTYRFARFIRQTLHHPHVPSQHNSGRPLRVLDIGCGSGAGALTVARSLRGRDFNLTLNDINPVALKYAQANMAAAELNANFLLGDVFTTDHGLFDLIISNPPYMKDSAGRAYRDGGDRLGLDFSLRLAQHCVRHLAPGGQLILYSGVAMTTQTDPFLDELTPLLTKTDCKWSYAEIDPDVFGEELEQPAYAAAHRIAAVGLVVTRSH